jgi:colanic acid/amylovoran biosynthesis glycosyltransferase
MTVNTAGDVRNDSATVGSVRVVYVTSRFPNSIAEPFLSDEVELLSHWLELYVVPMTIESRWQMQANAAQHTCALPIVNSRILFTALFYAFLRPLRTWRAFVMLLKADLRWKIVLKNSIIFPKALWLAACLRKWRIEHVHAHWASSSASMAWVAAQLEGITWSFTAHRWDISERNALAAKLGSCSFARAISGRAKQLLLRVHPGADVEVIHMGVQIPEVPATIRRSRLLRIMVPASLFPVKGHRYLLAALALLQKEDCIESCLLAGEGSEERALRELARRLELQNVLHFLGFVSREELLAYYRTGKVDAVVLPSISLSDGTHEGIPTALMEAMAFGLPVVSTNTGSIPELVEGAGLMVAPEDPSALASALRALQDPGYRAALGRRGREKVLREFNVIRTAARLAQRIEWSRSSYRSDTKAIVRAAGLSAPEHA